MRIGIIGAGQLGQMLGYAARELGFECRFLDPSDSPPAAQCGEVVQADFDDPTALAALAQSCDVVTYEFENVPVDALRHLEGLAPVYPPEAALRFSQDRLDEKQLFEMLSIPLPDYCRVDSRDDLSAAATKLGLPLVVKTRRFGYDGKGQCVANQLSDMDAIWDELGGQPLVAEQWVPFDFEVSCIGVRGVGGETAVYPLARNVHKQGILRSSISPIDEQELATTAATYVNSLLTHLDYVGALALELFVADGRLLANEFAPRVHNSGHWTIEGAATSQFENHIRAIVGMPLGATDSVGHAGMVNLIGKISETARLRALGKLHDYGKSARPGRKLGHVTVVASGPAERDALVDEIIQCVTQSTQADGTLA